MRRWVTAAALAGASVLALTGCGLPAGVDGDLVDDWAPVSAPKPFVPPVGVCVDAPFSERVFLSSFNPVDCTEEHTAEIVHVGTFTGEAAKRSTAPPQGSPEMRTAYADCDAQASKYVGAQWRVGRLWLGVVLPSEQGWAGGARWYRCDVSEVSSVEDDGPVRQRTASLRGALAKPSALNLTCYATKLTRTRTIESMPAADCAKPHDAEFVGVWQAPDIPYPAKDSDWSRFYTECRKRIADYVGVPNDNNMRYRSGVVAVPAPRQEWQGGNRGVRCYVWFSNRTLKSSLKGGGVKALPIQVE